MCVSTGLAILRRHSSIRLPFDRSRWYCPHCSNLLLLRTGSTSGQQEFFCQTCPYVFEIMKTHASKTTFKRKELDDVLGGEKAWENVDQTDALCPRCEHRRAFFFQVQTRSADEPMTTFYKCANPKCGTQWREQ
ncbi:hypothetical protein DFJ74DRAFT_601189 [Hyaloraphidium curvatum]|nr:hypothetical protein DFJ74DRAFT_601189 [Hyaloraphidium curvatum]